ncbi:HU family DNA-binding protein [Gemmatimonadota bacterium]
MAKEFFGQYLIRMGKVKQQDIDEALMLQEILHGSLGTVALAHDLITFKDVECILEKMDQHGKSFSDTTIELGILSRDQVEEVQKKYPEKRIYIGQLLVATGKLPPRVLEKALEKFEREKAIAVTSKMTKAGLIGLVAEHTGVGRATVKMVLEEAIDTLSQALVSGETVALRGFGTFKSIRNAARKARNPRTGKMITIPERSVPKLRYARKLRCRVEEETHI